jgi:hypothetical protein
MSEIKKKVKIIFKIIYKNHIIPLKNLIII